MSVLHSRGLLGDLALDCALRAAQLHATTSPAATSIERALRKELSDGALGSTGSLEDAKVWAEKDATLTAAAMVERCILARIGERDGKPPTKLLKSLMTRAMVAKTEHELLRTMKAVVAATGDDTLAAKIATESMKEVLQLRLPTELPSSYGGAEAVTKLKIDLIEAGLPKEVVTAAFPPGGAEKIDSATITSWLAVQLTMEQCGQLLSQIRERKVLVHGGGRQQTQAPRSIGGVGSQRRVRDFKEIAVRLKAKKAELHRWFREYEILATALLRAKTQAAGRTMRSSNLSAPLQSLLGRIPPVMTKEQLADPTWLPDTDGLSKASTGDTAFVDALRRLRTHTDEATRLAGINAEALVASIISARSDIAHRITEGLSPVLDAGPDGPAADSLRTASFCSGRHLAIARHFPRSVLPPQAWLHTTLYSQTGTPTLDKHALLVLEGWRVVLRNSVDQASMLLNGAEATLQGILLVSRTQAMTQHEIMPPAVAQLPLSVVMNIQPGEAANMDITPADVTNIITSSIAPLLDPPAGLDSAPPTQIPVGHPSLTVQTTAGITSTDSSNDDDSAPTTSDNDQSDEDLYEEGVSEEDA